MLYYIREHSELAPEIQTRLAALNQGRRKAAELNPLCSQQTLDLIASFQRTVVRELVGRTLTAAKMCNVKTILISGGVAANRELRETFDAESLRCTYECFFPSRELSTDNAAMIAAAAFARYDAASAADPSLNAFPNLPLGSAL